MYACRLISNKTATYIIRDRNGDAIEWWNSLDSWQKYFVFFIVLYILFLLILLGLCITGNVVDNILHIICAAYLQLHLLLNFLLKKVGI